MVNIESFSQTPYPSTKMTFVALTLLANIKSHYR